MSIHEIIMSMAVAIKEYCQTRDCDNCVFDDDGFDCKLKRVEPNEWDLTEVKE